MPQVTFNTTARLSTTVTFTTVVSGTLDIIEFLRLDLPVWSAVVWYEAREDTALW